ncbi:MAG: hypothetical protein QW386_04705 [Candidatus Bathyarchaeia archaeon]
MSNLKYIVKWDIICFIEIIIWTLIVGIPIFCLILSEAVWIYEYYTANISPQT